MQYGSWCIPTGRGIPKGIQLDDFVEVVFEDGEIERAEAHLFSWNWKEWDEDKISMVRIIQKQD